MLLDIHKGNTQRLVLIERVAAAVAVAVLALAIIHGGLQ
jgi:hypothetical protein